MKNMKKIKQYTFIDLFAGAGGFSEGFLQATYKNKLFNFLLANDINDNCELTHLMRYNVQLKMDAAFICQDISEPDFISNLKNKLKSQKVDVICGGPPCQSFSLAGKRMNFDKKDDLFFHYLSVIKEFKPKYFVMENVKGILTKDKGRIKKRIINEINSIIDESRLSDLILFTKSLDIDNLIKSFIIKRIELETSNEENRNILEIEYIQTLENSFKKLTSEIVDYQTSKMDQRINTIRHGLTILRRKKEWYKITAQIIKEKDNCSIDNDFFKESFDSFLKDIQTETIVKKINLAIDKLSTEKNKENFELLKTCINTYTGNFEELTTTIKDFCNSSQETELNNILKNIRLYHIDEPLVLNASDYGVPQNRERVIFVGCRKDQEFISSIPATVSEEEKVTVFEALHDLDTISNNESIYKYCPKNSYQKKASYKKYDSLIQKREKNGAINSKSGKSFVEWSRIGRLNERFKIEKENYYVKNNNDYINHKFDKKELLNHQTSNQSPEVLKRLEIIKNAGSYQDAHNTLLKHNLKSKKRNYNVLKPDSQSPTILTMPDDYIHYSSPRALTVREMARLQSFDDSFVFQGKRSTGGNNRKKEVPQYTLVGNAVPPLMAQAIANVILEKID